MCRLLRAGFDLHFTDFGHTCWMQKDGQTTKVYEDDPQSEAPLYNMHLRVLPPPTERPEAVGKKLLVAPIQAGATRGETFEGCEVELAGSYDARR